MDESLQAVAQVPAGALELPGGPVPPARLQDLVVLTLRDVEARAKVDDLGAQVAVDDGPRGGLRVLDGDLAGTLPQHAGHDGAVPLEFVPHVVLLFCRGDRPAFTARLPGSG